MAREARGARAPIRIDLTAEVEVRMKAMTAQKLSNIVNRETETFDEGRSVLVYECNRRILNTLLKANKPDALSHIVRFVYFMIKSSGLHFAWFRDEKTGVMFAEWCGAAFPDSITYETFVNGCFQGAAKFVEIIPPMLPPKAKITSNKN